MQALYTAAEVRELEEAADDSTRELMERAGRALADCAVAELGADGRVFILSGPGNNGGDGLVAARALREQGHPAALVLVGDAQRLPPDAADAYRAMIGAGIAPLDSLATLEAQTPGAGDVVIDAVFGTGLNRPPGGVPAEAIEAIIGFRHRGVTVVSADLPSGVASDTGEAFAPSVTADVTVVFGVAKPAHAMQPGRSHCGRQVFIPLGLPESTAPPQRALLEEQDIRAMMPTVRATDHKGTFGHVLVVAGSEGKTGAAALCALGALRAGAGLVTIAAPKELLGAILAHVPEAMGLPLEVGDEGLSQAQLELLAEAAEARDACVLGPGIARGQKTLALLTELLCRVSTPWVIDADGLNALATSPSVLQSARGPVILTPHPGELGRLLGQEVPSVQSDRLKAATMLQRHAGPAGLTVILKGAGTVIACSDGRVRLNVTGHPGLGTGGTGDVLAGILGALLAGGMSADDAACVGVHVHGLAADLLRESTGMRGLIASDLPRGLCRVWQRLEAPKPAAPGDEAGVKDG